MRWYLFMKKCSCTKFTFIELLVIIAMIAIMAAMLLPAHMDPAGENLSLCISFTADIQQGCGISTWQKFESCRNQRYDKIIPPRRFDGKPVTAELSLINTTSEFTSGTHTLTFPIQTDRYEAQFEKFARMIRNNTPGMYSYQHDLLVHEVTLAASRYIQWSK